MDFQKCLIQIGQNIKRFRTENNMSMDELASKLPFAASCDLKEYEEGKREMGVYTLMRIAEVLEIEPKELLSLG